MLSIVAIVVSLGAVTTPQADIVPSGCFAKEWEIIRHVGTEEKYLVLERQELVSTSIPIEYEGKKGAFVFVETSTIKRKLPFKWITVKRNGKDLGEFDREKHQALIKKGDLVVIKYGVISLDEINLFGETTVLLQVVPAAPPAPPK